MASVAMKDMVKKQQDLEEMVQKLVQKIEGMEKEIAALKGEQTKVATYSGVVRAEVEKVQARQERQDKVLRETNLVVTGLKDEKEESEQRLADEFDVMEEME